METYLPQRVHRKISAAIHDGQENAKIGTSVRMFNSQNCVVHDQGLKEVVLEGLDGYIVAEKDGRLLVCRLSEEQHIKEFAQS